MQISRRRPAFKNPALGRDFLKHTFPIVKESKASRRRLITASTINRPYL
jgi:hypothetical protein